MKTKTKAKNDNRMGFLKIPVIKKNLNDEVSGRDFIIKKDKNGKAFYYPIVIFIYKNNVLFAPFVNYLSHEYKKDMDNIPKEFPHPGDINFSLVEEYEIKEATRKKKKIVKKKAVKNGTHFK